MSTMTGLLRGLGAFLALGGAHPVALRRVSASHAARCTAVHGADSKADPVALVSECSMPLE